MLAVAALIPRKGFDVLFRALAEISDLDWQLTVVGSGDRDPATAGRLRDQLRAAGLEARVSFAGEAGEAALASYYDHADLFVLPTLYEGYGMAVAEALARGLPVISTATGSIGDLVGDEAGALVPAGDSGALAAALMRVLTDRSVRQRWAEGARRVRDRLTTWDDAARSMAEALDRVRL
jgi:glycosyltransferase involved in cell wall biosynthesis